ncbi:unnamed protein product [marine sediment metagenome]|uniref:Uncharacterized protein n=1 Tax=marine sediment metagenome TaxID=412755 RepID=X1PA77_9ZZZZ
MIRHDEMGTVANNKLTYIHTAVSKLIQFCKKHCWINDYSIADNTGHLWVKNA